MNDNPNALGVARKKRPVAELRQEMCVRQLREYIETNNGRFVVDDKGDLYIVIKGRKIKWNSHPNNIAMSGLCLDACDLTTLSKPVRPAIRIIGEKAYQTAGKLRRFSAVANRATLYVPIVGNKLLRVSPEGIKVLSEPETAGTLWVEHPERDPFAYAEANPAAGLEMFERLLIDSLSCENPSMRWFVGMHEGLFPYIRDVAPQRMLAVHVGQPMTGEIAMRNFLCLHGLDIAPTHSLKYLHNSGDTGLIALFYLDDKLRDKTTRGIIDHFVRLATGGQRAMASNGGKSLWPLLHWPVGVIITTDGLSHAELKAVSVEVAFAYKALAGDRTEIAERSHEICSALMPVFQAYFRIAAEHRPTPNPRPGFERYFEALADLLRAYGEVAEKPSGWAEEIIQSWDVALRRDIPERESSSRRLRSRR